MPQRTCVDTFLRARVSDHPLLNIHVMLRRNITPPQPAPTHSSRRFSRRGLIPRRCRYATSRTSSVASSRLRGYLESSDAMHKAELAGAMNDTEARESTGQPNWGTLRLASAAVDSRHQRGSHPIPHQSCLTTGHHLFHLHEHLPEQPQSCRW